MKIAITGAGGFLGTAILRKLSAQRNITVYAFAFNFEREKPTFVQAENIFPVDNGEAKKFDYSEIDMLLNCAFPRNAEDASFAAGLDFIQGVFDKAAADHVKSIVNISSQSVYSQKRQEPADETAPIVLESRYAVGKYMSELLINSLFKTMRHTNLRLSSLVGVGFDQRITNKFAKKIIAGEQIAITGGQQLFGFMDVRDAADGIIRLIQEKGKDWDEVYNFGSNRFYTLLEIAECARKIGEEFGYQSDSIEIKEDGVWQNSSVICNRFYDAFGWKPKYSLGDSIREIFLALAKINEEGDF